ncbi:hypothetical protein [Tardiphaga sp. 768_D3_N2_1]|uniref:hypothetical protein n=1 Tax=Tardiphaga sp. 768_D3_N2_1 TaxID=3240783 RepID=UPI003F8A6B2D
MISEAMAGASALKTAFDMAKALKDISDATIRNAAVIELQEKILSAQEAQFALVKRVDELEKQVTSFEGKRSQMQRYQLKDYGAGSFAYELKESDANGEPIHRACAACYQQGHVSILQFSHNSNGQDWYDCKQCKNNQHFGARIPYRSHYSGGSDF